MQDHMEMLGKHIAFLRSLDTDEFFDKEETEISQYAGTAMKELARMYGSPDDLNTKVLF